MSDQQPPATNKARSFQEVDLAAMRQTLSPDDRVIGIDFGDRKIGLAISDGMRSVASPVEPLGRGKNSRTTPPACSKYSKSATFGRSCGWPLQMDGTLGPSCQATIAFARNLRTLAGIDLPTLLWDERLTSSMVEKFLIGDMDMTRGKRRKIVDQMAAGDPAISLDAFRRMIIIAVAYL